jgi:hypothetical protein
MRWIFLASILSLSCTSNNSGDASATATDTYAMQMSMTRLPQAGVDPFRVTVTLTKNGVALSGQTLNLTIPKGTVGTVTDNGDGSYQFTVTPSVTGVYPVTAALGSSASITRKAVVLDTNLTGSGQPMDVPGDYVNTDGYEDGVTITPDGEYLFVQYGPVYMSGLLYHTTICASGSYSIGYDLNTCDGRTNSSIVFNPIGPYNNDYRRPGFPSGPFVGGKLYHVPQVVIGGVANGIVGFPTMFYGFKLQSDGTFAQPFKLAFNDERALNGPFGLSFKMGSNGTGTYLVAWNNYFNDLGDDKPDIYTGSITFGQDNSLGTVAYSGGVYSSITPNVTPVSFSSHVGVQGNPHMYYDTNGVVKSIWTDDEQVTHDLSVYRITAGTFPTGTWVKDTLPSDINTAGDENQPFFTGTKLIFRRDLNIVYHDYTPTNGACASGFTHNDCWGPEVILIGANGNTTAGQIYTVGEPTVAVRGGKTYLYFVYIESRVNTALTGGVLDYNANAGFVEIP